MSSLIHSTVGRVCSTALALAVVLTTVLMTVASPAHAAPGAPEGLSASGTPIPTLTWDEVPGATRYRVQGAENNTFVTTVFNQVTTSTSYTPTRVLKGGALYWRVQAEARENGSLIWGPWAETTFTAPDPAVPTGVTISAGQQVLPPVSPPVISWDPVAGATGYEVEMDAEGDSVGGTVHEVESTTYVWPDPQGVGERQGSEDFFVRVRALFDNNIQSDWSAYTSYDVQQLPPVTASTCEAGLICAPHPVNGPRPSVTVQDVAFAWDPVKGAKEYEIWVALDPDFNNQVEKRKVTSTHYSPMTTYDNNDYYWKVRPWNAAGAPTPWPAEPSRFTRRWPQSPDLVYPPVAQPASVVGDDVYFQWTPVRHATRYELWVSADQYFTEGPLTSVCYTDSTTYTPGFNRDKCVPPQGTTVFWRVRALDGPKRPEVNGIYSDTGRFVYDSGRIQPLAPANGSTVTVPTFRWRPSPDANRYRITVTGDHGSVTQTTSALSWTPTRLLPTDRDSDDPTREPDYFTWTVTAIDGDGTPSPTFHMGSVWVEEAPIPGGARPLEPLALASGQITSRFPALAWQPYPSTVDNPVYYKLRVSETPGYVLSESVTQILGTELAYPAVTDHSTYFLTPDSADNPPTWWVDVFDAGTDQLLDSGPPSTFRIESPTRAAGHQVALDGRALDLGDSCSRRLVVIDGVTDEGTVCSGLGATPVLDWESVPGAGGYQVYVADDSDFTNLIYNGIETTNSRWTPADIHAPSSLPDNESGPAYYWYVRPCSHVMPAVNCGPSPSGTLDSGASAFRKVSPQVQLTSPAANATFADQVTFTWEDYHLTNHETEPNYGGSTPPYQTAQRYRLQVAQSATINDSNAIDDVVVDQATYTAFTETYPEGDLWWRVQAIDAANNRLAWSETRKLVKATPAADLQSDPAARPAFDSRQTAGSTLFRWSAGDHDATWELEVYRNDDSVPSPGNLVFRTTTKQAAYAHDEPLAPSSTAYRWRIRRTDVAGQVGRWSNLGRFFVDPMPVTLLAPTQGIEVGPTSATFTWEPYGTTAAQATRYVIDVEPRSPDASNPNQVTTAATAWTPYAALVTGTYGWTVRALDAANNEIGRSAEWTFTVDAGIEALEQTAIFTPDGSSMGDTLTSAPPVWDEPNVQNSYQWLRNGNAIRGATEDTYTLVLADFGTEISLRVTGTKAGFTNGVSISSPVEPSAGDALIVVEAPQLSGTFAPGQTVRTTAGTWSQDRPRFTYQWLRDGNPIAEATRNSYRLTPADAARRISVRVTASVTGYQDGVSTSREATVAKNSSSTSLRLSSSTIKRTKRVKATITVAVPGVERPRGVLVIKDGKKKIKQIKLRPKKLGQVTTRLPRIKRVGRHKIRVIYKGNATTQRSRSSAVILVVSR